MTHTGSTTGKPAHGSEYRVVVGLGKTGFSLARFLKQQGLVFYVVDTRREPPSLEMFRQQFPGVYIEAGVIDEKLIAGAREILMSPGVSLDEAFLTAARAARVPVAGDIEIFFRQAQAPIVAITGSNAKSTVTTLVGEMAKAAGIRVAVGGNLGTPALELLDANAELYVLELSSFQLETVSSFTAKVAVCLNISEDHMDRYHSLADYVAAKHRIYERCETAIFNRNDQHTQPAASLPCRRVSFGLNGAAVGDYGCVTRAGSQWLVRGEEALIAVNGIRLVGMHNMANCLAALAIGEAAGLQRDAMLAVLKSFPGLPHRCQWVADIKGVRFIDDSKGTNVGATLAAIEGLAEAGRRNLVLIAGGEGKGADFSPLAPACARAVKTCVLIGRDGKLIEQALGKATTTIYATDMPQAVRTAAGIAQRGDTVLLSPACASFDMFRNYEHRGECFVAAVKELAA